MTLILGLESSCDETAAALVDSDRRILAHRVAGQEAEHSPFGGVVPEIAARAHVDRLAPIVAGVLADAGVSLAEVDAIAATAGPGLIGGVMVGLVTGKALAHAANKPLIAVNHLEGHALSPRLVEPGLAFPYLLLLVSGGHCQLLLVKGVGDYRRLATTIDDAAGEAFDKTAKLLGLGYPGGPAIERLARQGDAQRFPLPRPLKGKRRAAISAFAGLKTAVARWCCESLGDSPTEQDKADLAASVPGKRCVDCWSIAAARAMPACSQASRLESRRRVAANGAIRGALTDLAARHDKPFVAPPLWLCTDNGAMIAWAGAERFAVGLTDNLSVAARPRWPLDPAAEAVRGAGVKA